MTSYLQKHRPLQVTTPLGEESLLVTAFRGGEQLSRLFSFELDLIAHNSTVIDFSKLVGNEISLRVATPGQDGATDWRYVCGICACFSQGNRNEEFTSYSAEVVPKVWLLTRRAQSRIFQQKSVPDILKEVLGGFDYDLQLRGQYEPREYCVQYRETDFDFASRLMEEEGIYYFFQHHKGGHKMVIADTSLGHLDVPGLTNPKYKVVEGGAPQGDHIFAWRKSQALRASKYSLWDHSFQQPTQNLEAKASIMPSVKAGSILHQLNGQANAPLEIYDFPGGYALRFDGVSPSGGDQSQRLQKILEDNQRTVKLRMETEAAQALTIQGTSGCRNFVAGHKFRLDRHFDGEGDYVLVSVTHDASLTNPYRTGAESGPDMLYSNKFTCIPFQLPYRPSFRTPKPFIHGVQNALVTGPPGEEIFTDKYGRVKVQFYWDRQGKKDANSSCWLRVSTYWAGKQWGAMQVPRIGQEVIVAFVEGNPDEPVIVGSVYNPETMPPYGPGKGVISGLKSNTHKGKGYNEMSMDDTAGKEKILIHAQHDMNSTVEHDHSLTVHNNHSSTVDGTHTETVKKDTKITITEGSYTHTVAANTASHTVNKEILVTSQTAHIHVQAATEIKLEVGASKLLMMSNGNIELTGLNLAIKGAQTVEIQGGSVTSQADADHNTRGAIVLSEASASNTVKGAMVMLNP